MGVHLFFDVAAWLSAWTIGRFVSRRYFSAAEILTTPRDHSYLIALALGAIVGVWLFGSHNLHLAGFWQVGHSIAGAVAGGIVAVDLFKRASGIRGSTGGQ